MIASKSANCRVAGLAFALATLGGTGAYAQGSGMLNLMPPAVLVTPVVPAPAASSAKVAKAPVVVSVDKSLLNGEVTLALVLDANKVQRVQVRFSKKFHKPEYPQVLRAALAIQQDVRLGCQKLCKAVQVAPPAMQADGSVAFDLAIAGLDRMLNATDMLALLEARPLAKTPAIAQAAARAESPAPADASPVNSAPPSGSTTAKP